MYSHVSHLKMFQNRSSFEKEKSLKLVYGDPEPDFINNVESFGDLILERLTNYGDSVGLVSISFAYHHIRILSKKSLYRLKLRLENHGSTQQ